MNDQSQDYYGPYIISFHDFVDKISDAEYFYSLTKLEHRLLRKFADTIDRSKYRVNLSDIKFHKRETWAKMCWASESHVSDYFRALQELRIIDVVKVGKRNHHKFAQPFLNALMSELQFVPRSKPAKKKKTGDKTLNRSETGDLIGPKPGTYKVRNRGPIRSETGDLCSNIEDFSSLISLPPSHTSSFPPETAAVDNVDNFTAQERRLSNWYDENQLEKARAFIAKLKGSQLGRLDDFLDFLDNDWRDELGTKGMNLIWAKWSLGEMTKANPLRIVSNAPQGELGAL